MKITLLKSIYDSLKVKESEIEYCFTGEYDRLWYYKVYDQIVLYIKIDDEYIPFGITDISYENIIKRSANFILSGIDLVEFDKLRKSKHNQISITPISRVISVQSISNELNSLYCTLDNIKIYMTEDLIEMIDVKIAGFSSYVNIPTNFNNIKVRLYNKNDTYHCRYELYIKLNESNEIEFGYYGNNGYCVLGYKSASEYNEYYLYWIYYKFNKGPCIINSDIYNNIKGKFKYPYVIMDNIKIPIKKYNQNQRFNICIDKDGDYTIPINTGYTTVFVEHIIQTKSITFRGIEYNLTYNTKTKILDVSYFNGANRHELIPILFSNKSINDIFIKNTKRRLYIHGYYFDKHHELKYNALGRLVLVLHRSSDF